jgi:hypothetical protein
MVNRLLPYQTNKDPTTELLSVTVFSMWSVPKLYKKYSSYTDNGKYKRLKLASGQAYDRSED